MRPSYRNEADIVKIDMRDKQTNLEEFHIHKEVIITEKYKEAIS